MLEFSVMARDVAIHDTFVIVVSCSVMVAAVIMSVIVVFFLFVALIVT